MVLSSGHEQLSLFIVDQLLEEKEFLYKVKNKSANKTIAKRKELPVIVYIGLAASLLLGYAIGRIALDAFPHPYPWLSGLVGGVIGFHIGWSGTGDVGRFDRSLRQGNCIRIQIGEKFCGINACKK